MPQTSFWHRVNIELKKGERVFLALVAENTKGSPGTPGAKLMISTSDQVFGTIGGGIMEHDIIERARSALSGTSYAPEIQHLLHRSRGQGELSGMICSGSQTNVYYLCQSPQDLAAVAAIDHVLKEDRDGLLIISPSGLRVAAEKGTASKTQIHLTRDEKTWRYEEQLLNRKRVAIIGGGHCAMALSRQMHHLGYAITVFDARRNLSTLADNEWAHRIEIIDDYAEAGSRINHEACTAAVVMTHNFLSDYRALLGLARKQLPFLGLLGSEAKIKSIYKELKKQGVSQDWLDTIFAPVGLACDSDTPEEIAVSIAAQILQERNIGHRFLLDA